MNPFKTRLLATTVVAGLALAGPSFAWAQTAPANAEQAQQASPSEDAQDEEQADTSEVEAVVVTGTRIRRNEFTSSAPIQVITSEQSTLEGLVDTTQILQESSVASGSFQTNNQLTGFVTTGGPGANSVSLRGLGASRTLVLLNGRRVGPAGVQGTVGPVDLNVIPSSIIERVEILKDGASSIYGSDAVAGVINIITKTNLDGAVLDVYANQPFKQGGAQYRVSGAWGRTFDKGYINVGADFYEQKVLRVGDRDQAACAADYLFDGVTHQRLDFQGGPGQGAQYDGGFKCYGLLNNIIRTGSYGDVIFAEPGVTYPGTAQGNSGGTNNAAGGFGSQAVPFGFVRQSRAGFPETFPYGHNDSPFVARASLLSPVKRYSLTVTGAYNISDNVEAYGELLLNRRESEQYSYTNIAPSISTANPLNPYGASLGTLLPVIGRSVDANQTVDYMRVVGGLRGDFTGGFLNGWAWDVYAQHSRSDGEYSVGFTYADRLAAVSGTNICDQSRINISASRPGGTCATIPGGIPFLSQRVVSGDFNDAERLFLFGVDTGHTTYEQSQIEASMTGDLFNVPAGAVGAAVGVSWRSDKIDDTPGPDSIASNMLNRSSAGITRGDDTVREVFGEVEVPLVKGAPLIESLDLQVSGRYTDYDSYGSNTTYKLGLNWQITPEWRIRATKGTSFRAPALYELYLANQTGFLSQLQVDPCIQYENSSNPNVQANCASQGIPQGYVGGSPPYLGATVVSGGGAGVLSAETSKAETVGVIWTPDFVNLSVALDYFDIQVDNEVTKFGAGSIVGACYRSANFPNDPFCSLVQRDLDPASPTFGRITQVNDSYVNVASQVNRGLDLTVRYTHEWDFGKLTIDSQVTWQLDDTTQLLGDAAAQDYNGSTTEPDVTGNLNFRFDRGPWTAFWGVDFIGKTSDAELGGDLGASTRYSTTCRVGTGAGQTIAPGTVGPCSALLGGGPLTVLAVPVYFKVSTETTIYHDVSLRYKMDTWTLAAGVQNLFDEAPPSQSSGQFRIGTAALNLYDVVGRRAFFNISKRF